MLHKRTLERKLFGWLLVSALAPTLALLLATWLAGAETLNRLGTLGPWSEIAASGRTLTDAIEAGAPDDVLREAASHHRTQLSESLLQASRWGYLGERVAAAAPLVIGGVGLIVALLALLMARRLARELARPIGELVTWTAALGDGRDPPPPGPAEAAEPVELGVLRSALRGAAAEIARARARAVEQERVAAWGEMARRIAHEMKNPLTPLRLAAYRLTAATGANGAIEEAVSVIREETERLDELARSFALIGRPVSGAPTLVDLVELMDTLLRTDVPDPIATSLLAEDGTAVVSGQYDALVRAFRNLVKNAVEAVQQGGRPGAIGVRIVPGPDHVEVSIADDGPGIPEGMAEVIFEPDRTLKAGGTGLGLTIVQQVVSAHGGTVRAGPRAGGGAEFVVRLPHASVAVRADAGEGA